MWPLGQYERLVHEIKRRENPDIPVTFGLLIADYRQQKCREYIINYMERFDYKSGKYINFYLPGYIEGKSTYSDPSISIRNKDYFFDTSIYLDFLHHLEIDFEIEYPYNPVLILMEYDRGHFKTAQKIVIELDANGAEIKKVGNLFEEIFAIAKKYVSINDFSKGLIKNEIKRGLLDSIIEGIDNRYINAIYNQINQAMKFRLV